MSDVIDIAHAIEQAGGSSELARDLFTMLINDLPGLKDSINQAHQQGDAQALWDHTHKVYGATAYCGVPALRRAAKNLEDTIKAGTSDHESPLMELNEAVDALLLESDGILAMAWE